MTAPTLFIQYYSCTAVLGTRRPLFHSKQQLPSPPHVNGTRWFLKKTAAHTFRSQTITAPKLTTAVAPIVYLDLVDGTGLAWAGLGMKSDIPREGGGALGCTSMGRIGHLRGEEKICKADYRNEQTINVKHIKKAPHYWIDGL